MDTDSFIVYIKIEYIYVDVAKDIEPRCDTSNYELDRALPEEKYENVIRLIKNKLGGYLMADVAVLKRKTYSYLIYDGDKSKKAKDTKRSALNQKLKFEEIFIKTDSKYYLLNKCFKGYQYQLHK